MNSASRIDFFVIGAQKCATSWLYYCLREHPQIALSHKKNEENYYGGALHRERGDEWFFSLYQPERPGWQVRGSVSVDYVYDSAALLRTLQVFPEAKLILCLRNPRERSASAGQFLARRGVLPGASYAENLRQGMDDHGSGVVSPAAELVTRSLYAAQLQPLLSAGAASRLLVLGYDELCARPLECLQRIYAFIGVQPGFSPPSLSSRPKQNANIAWLNRLESLAPRSKLVGKVMDHANQWLCRLGFKRAGAMQDAELDGRFRQILESDLRLLDQLLAQIPPAQRLIGPRRAEFWR